MLKEDLPRVRTEANQRGMVQFHISPETFVISVQEVSGAPDSDRTVIGTGGKVFSITAEVEACHVSTVTLGTDEQLIGEH